MKQLRFLILLNPAVLTLLTCCSQSDKTPSELVPVYDDDGNFIINFANPNLDERYPLFPEMWDEVPTEKFEKLEEGTFQAAQRSFAWVTSWTVPDPDVSLGSIRLTVSWQHGASPLWGSCV